MVRVWGQGRQVNAALRWALTCAKRLHALWRLLVKEVGALNKLLRQSHAHCALGHGKDDACLLVVSRTPRMIRGSQRRRTRLHNHIALRHVCSGCTGCSSHGPCLTGQLATGLLQKVLLHAATLMFTCWIGEPLTLRWRKKERKSCALGRELRKGMVRRLGVQVQCRSQTVGVSTCPCARGARSWVHVCAYALTSGSTDCR